MTEYDDMVNESGRIDDPYFQIWSEKLDKEDQEKYDEEAEDEQFRFLE